MSLNLIAFSDRELLILVYEETEGSEDGYADSGEIATVVGLTGKWAKTEVGTRMAAMRRFGVIDRKPDTSPARWQLTELGKAMAFGKLRSNQEKAVESANPGQLLLLARAIARTNGDQQVSRNLLRREWTREMILARR